MSNVGRLIERVSPLIFRVVGAPPTRDAPRSERLRWVRRFYRITIPTVAVATVWVIGVRGNETWPLIAAAVIWLGVLEGFVSVSRSIRRAERVEKRAG